MGCCTRHTLFKIPDPENVARIHELYATFLSEQLKDGKPYVFDLNVYTLEPKPRSKGYTVSVKVTFANKEDMVYYDKKCPAHQRVKAEAEAMIEKDEDENESGNKTKGFLVVWWDQDKINNPLAARILRDTN